MTPLLEVENVRKSFGGIAAVDGFSMNVMEGETLGLIGPNGAGKTTLFNLVTGLTAPDSGRIRFRGREIGGLRPHNISRLGVARTFQTPRPFSKMTVAENVMAGLYFGRHRETSARQVKDEAMDLLSIFSLEDQAQRPAGALTLRNRRRLELARALSTDPLLLMLDEVMAGLSYPEAEEMAVVLEGLRKTRGVTMVVTEHVVKTIFRLCDRVVVMDRGSNLAEGTPSEVVQDGRVIAAYMGKATVQGIASS